MQNRVKVGLITEAAGAHLSAYFSALSQTEEVGSVTLSDPSRQAVESARKILGEKLSNVYEDHVQLLANEKPVMALVSMEAVNAPPVIRAALEANCHVYAEKPACLRATDFQELATMADSKHRHLMLALANRINPPVMEARRLVRAGKIGKAYGLEMHLIADQTRLTRPSYHSSWFAQKARAGGGHLSWLGIHWLDLAMFITGSKIEEVSGFAGNVGGQPIDIEDSAAMCLKFGNGTFGTLTSGYYLDRGYHSHIKIWGSHGWLHLEPMQEIPLQWYSTRNTKAAKVQQYDGPKEPKGYTPFVRAAVRASAGLQDPPVTAEESLHVLKVVYSFYQASQSGRSKRVS